MKHEEFDPIVNTEITRSHDGKYVLHKTIITDIKPIEYYKWITEDKEVK